MEIIRNGLFYRVGCSLTSALVNCNYSIEYTGMENIPEQGPALLLPKHQSHWDTLLEGDLLRRRGRLANLVMKYSLPRFFEYGGGIRVSRPKDMLRLREKIRRMGYGNQKTKKIRKKMRDMKKNNIEAMRYVGFLLCSEDEIVIIHPEGTRVENAMGELQMGIINYVGEIERPPMIKIPAIPIGIEYEDTEKIRPRVNVRVGKPLDLATPDLEKIIRQNLENLSGL